MSRFLEDGNVHDIVIARQKVVAEMKVFEGVEPTLEEAQAFVGGYIELVHLDNGDQILVNEEGLLHGFAVNMSATILCKMFGNGCTLVGNAMLLKGEKARWT